MRNYVECDDKKFMRGRDIIKIYKNKSNKFYKERWKIKNKNFDILEFECSLDFNTTQLSDFRKIIYKESIIKENFVFEKTIKIYSGNSWSYLPITIRKIYKKESD